MISVFVSTAVETKTAIEPVSSINSKPAGFDVPDKYKKPTTIPLIVTFSPFSFSLASLIEIVSMSGAFSWQINDTSSLTSSPL